MCLARIRCYIKKTNKANQSLITLRHSFEEKVVLTLNCRLVAAFQLKE